jgi:hypothetical protein
LLPMPSILIVHRRPQGLFASARQVHLWRPTVR